MLVGWGGSFLIGLFVMMYKNISGCSQLKEEWGKKEGQKKEQKGKV